MWVAYSRLWTIESVATGEPIMTKYLTVAVRTSGYTWGTTMWCPLDGAWSRLDSATMFAKVALYNNNSASAYRVYDTDGVVYAEGK